MTQLVHQGLDRLGAGDIGTDRDLLENGYCDFLNGMTPAPLARLPPLTGPERDLDEPEHQSLGGGPLLRAVPAPPLQRSQPWRNSFPRWSRSSTRAAVGAPRR